MAMTRLIRVTPDAHGLQVTRAVVGLDPIFVVRVEEAAVARPG